MVVSKRAVKAAMNKMVIRRRIGKGRRRRKLSHHACQVRTTDQIRCSHRGSRSRSSRRRKRRRMGELRRQTPLLLVML
jgi:hypothetical protein